MDILFILKVLMRRKWYLIAIPILAAVSTYFFTSNIQPVYKSTARLGTSFTTDDQIKIDNERLNLRDAGVKFNNLIQTMNSELVLNMLSYRLIINDLTSSKPFRSVKSENEGKAVMQSDEITQSIRIFRSKYDSIQLLSSFDPVEAKLIKLLSNYGYASWQLKDKIEIKWIKDTDFITVQGVSEDPLLSAFIVNSISEEYIRYDNSLKANSSDQSVTFFDGLVKEKKRVLDENTKLLNDFKVANGVVNFQVESSTKMNQISEYSLRKEQLESDIQRLEISLASVKRKINEFQNGNPATDQATINANIVRIREKISQLDEEYTRTGSNNQELLTSVKDLRYQLQVEMSKLSQTSTSTVRLTKQDLVDQKEKFDLELEITKANLQNVNNMINVLRGNVTGQASKEASIAELQREADKSSEEYLQALDRFNTERSKSLVSSSAVKIVIKGQPNGSPEFSKRFLLIALSWVSSFAVCIFVIIFLEYIDVRIKTPQQFKKFVKIHLSGSVNDIDTKQLNLIELFSSSENKSQEKEVFKHFLRKLRYEVESSKSKVLLVTSTKPSEGKTFIILCIAYLLSLLQKKILIIDSNFKNNSLTQIMLKKNENFKKLEQGIFVKGRIGSGEKHEMSEDDFASTIIYPTMYKGINIIGNSGGSESPSEIFAGKDFGKMIETLSENYDYIIMEGPSLNNYSDTKELIDFVDKVIVVFSADSNLKQLDRESIDYLRNLNGKLMGAVLNKIKTKDLAI